MTTRVESWDPQVGVLSDDHRHILNELAESDQSSLQLNEPQRAILQAAFSTSPVKWEEFVEPVSNDTLIAWVKVLVILAESYAELNVGANSPVIPLVRVLKRRASYPADMTAWIKTYSSNKFLPYGSLSDRL